MKIFCNNKESDLKFLSKDEYEKDFVNTGKRKVAKRAFEKAWEIRNFEIEMYWKRATYFWALIASAFVGYYALVNSDGYMKPDRFDHVEVYFVICIGFILSIAWWLTNKGSKAWQRHWEVHVDLLEDKFTGPLYKTVHPSVTYSVSKINEIVSAFVSMIWFLLGVKYLVEQDLFNFNFKIFNINVFIGVSTIGVMYFLCRVFFGYGRGRFSERKVTMHRRSVIYEDK